MSQSLDRASYEKLFQSQAEKLRRMAYLFLHEVGAAEDALQETFLLGLAHLHTYRGDARPDVWLYSIALNVCRQAYRKARVDSELPDGKHLHRDRRLGRSSRGPVTSLMRRETVARLTIALGYLTDLQREVFVLHYIEDLPYEDIAPMLGISVVATRGMAHRAKRTLRTRLPPSFALPGDR